LASEDIHFECRNEVWVQQCGPVPPVVSPTDRNLMMERRQAAIDRQRAIYRQIQAGVYPPQNTNQGAANRVRSRPPAGPQFDQGQFFR
jgi:hypothetical protein